MLRIKFRNGLFRVKRPKWRTRLEEMGFSPRYSRFELVLFKRYRVLLIEIGKNPSHKMLYWIEFRICGLGIDYNVEAENNKRWFNSFYDKYWSRY